MPADSDADLLREMTAPDFNPMAMVSGLMTGQTRLHSVFLGPVPPSLQRQISQFLVDGTGPLAALVDQFRQQGAPAPLDAVRALLQAAKGLCVVVIQLDHGVASIPQLFFGHLEENARQQVVAACGETFPVKDALVTALEHLERKLASQQWPTLISGPDAGGDVHEYWLDLGAQVVGVRDQGMGNLFGGVARMNDLAWFVAHALPACLPGGKIGPEDLDLLVRCQLMAGSVIDAGQGIDALVQSGEFDEEGFIELITGFTDGAIAAEAGTPGVIANAGAWLGERAAAWSETTGVDYDLWRAVLRLHTAAGVGPEVLLPVVERLWACNRKAARQDLTKEPLWQVMVADPGELLDTAAAAELTGRSTSFLAKRLESATIPFCKSGDQLRLPRPALSAWKAVMEQWQLLG